MRLRNAIQEPLGYLRVTRSANQTIGNSVVSPIEFNVLSEQVGDALEFIPSPGTGTGGFVVAKRRMLVSALCQINWNTNATGFRQHWFAFNSATAVGDTIVTPQGGTSTDATISYEDILPAGSWLAVHAFQNSGIGLDILLTAPASPRLTVAVKALL